MQVPEEDLEFYQLMSPTFAGKKFLMPAPKLNPLERRQRRMAFRNERHLYYRNCDLTGRRMLSTISEDKPYKVYYFKDWLSDAWDVMDYFLEPDFEKSFFSQFKELLQIVPMRSLNISDDMENCDFCNYGGFSQHCYLSVAPFQSQNCLYSRVPYKCVYDVDGFANIECQYCYECIASENSYQCFFSQYVKNCSESAFLLDCVGCKNCFGCVGLKQQEYCFLNKKYSPEEYREKTSGILGNRDTLDQFAKFFHDYSLNFPRKFARNFKTENCSGDLLRNSKNCHDCFDLMGQQDSRYCELGGALTHHAYDCTIAGFNVVNCYEQIDCVSCNQCAFGIYVNNNQNSYYVMNCENCEDCFGCIGLRRKKHCIFNKQYTPEDYEKTVAKIIEKMIADGEWGEMFPIDISPFAYNETLANDYFPLSESEAQAKGWGWREESPGPRDGSDLTKCSETGKLFKIAQQEREFLERFGIAMPNKSPEARFQSRLRIMNPYQLWERTTSDGVNVLSPYAPDRPEQILSEEAYLAQQFLL